MPRAALLLHGPAASAFRDGVRAFGELGFGLRDYAAHLQQILERLDVAADNLSLSSLCLTDLFLALGCLRGDERAYRALIRAHEAEVLAHARRAGVGEDEAREEWQALLVRLVGGGSASPLRSYAGRGRLAVFLRVSHLRSVLRRRRGAPAAPTPELLAASALDRCADRERAAILADVVQAALVQLAPAERELLVCHHCDGCSLTRLAVDLALLDADTPHLRTAASRLYRRVLTRFRAAVFERARAVHNLDGGEIEALLREPPAEERLQADRPRLPTEKDAT